MVTSLLRGELTDGWQHAESVTSQHNDIAWLAVDETRDLGVGNEFDGVSTASVLSDRNIVVVRYTRCRVVNDVLEDGTKPDGIEDFGFLLSGKVDSLGVASSFDVKDTGI